jgi:hypothetical protein
VGRLRYGGERRGISGPGKMHTAVGAGDDLGRVAGCPGVGETTITPTRPRSAAAARHRSRRAASIRSLIVTCPSCQPRSGTGRHDGAGGSVVTGTPSRATRPCSARCPGGLPGQGAPRRVPRPRRRLRSDAHPRRHVKAPCRHSSTPRRRPGQRGGMSLPPPSMADTYGGAGSSRPAAAAASVDARDAVAAMPPPRSTGVMGPTSRTGPAPGPRVMQPGRRLPCRAYRAFRADVTSPVGGHD